jgi:hypothetical protein
LTLGNKIRAAMNPDLAHVIAQQTELQTMLSFRTPLIEDIAQFLDSLDHPSRLAAVRSLGAKQLTTLFDLAEGYRLTCIDDVVTKDTQPKSPVRHFGKNSLPVFTIFEKRFMRPAADAVELWGYNHQTMAPLTGPGYFVAYNDPDRGEVLIDYNQVPGERPAGWPDLAENTQGLSRLVYGFMIDRLRGVTEQVSIGRAWKKGKIQKAWFALCRE